jgi:hypothetical protein
MIYPSLYQNIGKLEDILDDKLDVADEIVSFIKGAQFNIFTRIETMKRGNQANLGYVSQVNIAIIGEIFESRQPWKEMTRANEALTTIGEEIKTLQAEAQNEVLNLIAERLSSIKSIPTFELIDDSLRKQIELFFSTLEGKAKDERYIGNLKAMHTDIENAYNNSLRSINKWVEDAESRKATATQTDNTPAAVDNTPKRPVKTIVRKATAMDISFNKQILETEADVEAYIDELKKKMLDYIHQNKNIMLN